MGGFSDSSCQFELEMFPLGRVRGFLMPLFFGVNIRLLTRCSESRHDQSSLGTLRFM